MTFCVISVRTTATTAGTAVTRRNTTHPAKYYRDSFERSFDHDYPDDNTPRGYDDITPHYDDPDMTPRGYPDDDFIPRYSPINDGYQSPRGGRYDDYDDRGYRGNGYDYDDYDDRYYDSRDDRYGGYDRNSYEDDRRYYDDDDRNFGSISRGNSYSPPLGGSSFDSPQPERRAMGSNRSSHDYNRTTMADYGLSRGSKDSSYSRGQQDYNSPRGYPESPFHPTGRSDTDSEPLYYNSRPLQDKQHAQHRPQSFMNSRWV